MRWFGKPRISESVSQWVSNASSRDASASKKYHFFVDTGASYFTICALCTALQIKKLLAICYIWCYGLGCLSKWPSHFTKWLCGCFTKEWPNGFSTSARESCTGIRASFRNDTWASNERGYGWFSGGPVVSAAPPPLALSQCTAMSAYLHIIINISTSIKDDICGKSKTSNAPWSILNSNLNLHPKSLSLYALSPLLKIFPSPCWFAPLGSRRQSWLFKPLQASH